MYIGDYLSRRCVYTPEDPAIIDVSGNEVNRCTYREMNQRANQLASWMQARSIHKDDRIGMLACDGIHFYDVFLASSKIGAIFVPYNWRLHPREIEAQLTLTTPKIVFHSDDEPIEPIIKHLRNCAKLPKFVDISERNYREIFEGSATGPAACGALTADDTACLLFTGGTTGKPKAAQISHRQIVWNTFNAQLADVLGSDRFLNIFPMFHAGGLFAFSVPMLILGGTIIQTKKFDPVEVLNLIEKERATIFAGVPTTFQMLSEAPNWAEADLSSLRYCLSGGAPMPVALIRKYQSEKKVVFRQGFGMTEFGPDVFSLASRDSERKAGSIGKPNFFVDARVVDTETNQPLPANEIGELVLRGPVATTGYFNNPEATKAAFDKEHYFHTGDLAYVDDEGYFFIVDRLKDMFISGGENVYPAAIEAVLCKHPAVNMCAVIGVEDEKWGQAGCACVVLKQDKAIDEKELLNYLSQKLAKYKIPKRIVFLEKLPTSGAGKILKPELRRLINEKNLIPPNNQIRRR